MVAQSLPTILQIIPQLDTGGAELSAVEIAEAIVSAGARALVLAEPGRLTHRIASAGGEFVPFPAATKNPLRILANAQAIKRLIRAEDVALVHARSRAPAWSALIASRHSRIPFVTTYHGAYGETNAAKRLYNSVMARGDVVIANSRFTAGLIATRYAVDPERIEPIHRGIDPSKFDPRAVGDERVALLRASWGVGLGDRVILQAARLTAWKGQGVLIDAAARLHANGLLDNAVVVLAGDAQGRTDYVRSLHSRIDAAGLQDKVRLVGHVDDMAAAYLAAYVTVIASTDPEAFGRTAIEAAAMGSPVIATAIGAPPETVLAEPSADRCSFTGWLVPPGDSALLSQRLGEALALTPAEQSALAARARAHVLANFVVEGMQRRTLAVYDRLLGTVLERRFTERGAAQTLFPRQP